ncbi:hypothetical protein VTO73DRAFT_13433 [Trametes versicolor]
MCRLPHPSWSSSPQEGARYPEGGENARRRDVSAGTAAPRLISPGVLWQVMSRSGRRGVVSITRNMIHDDADAAAAQRLRTSAHDARSGDSDFQHT